MAFPSLRELVDTLQAAFPRQPIQSGHYVEELADVPIESLAPAVLRLLRSPGEWVPTIGDIRAEVASAELGLPTEREAAAQVEARARWARSGSRGTAPVVHPLVREALDRVGGWYALRVAERPEVVRGQMLRYYREAREEAIRELAVTGWPSPGAVSGTVGYPDRQ